jgi:hypothetical protein
MGAWGEGPYDNDSAADAFSVFCDETNLSIRINDMLNHEHYEVQRADAYILEGLGRVYVYDIDKIEDDLSYAITKLQDMLDDDLWLDGWDSRTAIEEEIQVQIDNLTENYPAHPSTPLEEAIDQWRK